MSGLLVVDRADSCVSVEVTRLCSLGCVLGVLTGCGGTEGSSAPWTESRQPTAVTSHLVDAGIMAPRSNPLPGAAAGGSPASNAGRTATGGGGSGSQARECSIPNELEVLASDTDGGTLDDCQNVPRKLIANDCNGGICHDSNGPAGGLDLMAPCLAERLVDVKSRCDGSLLLDTADPTRSFLSDKLNNLKPRCGYSMPDQGHLPPDKLRCMNAWIAAVIRVARASRLRSP